MWRVSWSRGRVRLDELMRGQESLATEANGPRNDGASWSLYWFLVMGEMETFAWMLMACGYLSGSSVSSGW